MIRLACARLPQGCAVLLALLTATAVVAEPVPGWERRLLAALPRVEADHRLDIGVYVRDLDTGQSAAWKADETWYLASTVKLPVALVVLGDVQRGVYTLGTPITLRRSDLVDGAGPTKNRRVGSQHSVGWLLQQMMGLSDNTATDMLIGLVRVREVNSLVQALVPGGLQPVTTIADVRRHIYAQLTPAAMKLSGSDFMLLKQQRSDADRRRLLSSLVRVAEADFRLPTVRDAYDAYYATGLNSGRLDAYGELLAQVAQGQVLDATHTAYLLEVMARSQTGAARIKAGLPPGVRWAHKTGTQSARTCDSGLITVPRLGRDQRVVVAACTRGDHSLAAAERALRQVGAAICRSGLIGARSPDHVLTACPVEPPLPTPVPEADVDVDVDAEPGVR